MKSTHTHTHTHTMLRMPTVLSLALASGLCSSSWAEPICLGGSAPDLWMEKLSGDFSAGITITLINAVCDSFTSNTTATATAFMGGGEPPAPCQLLWSNQPQLDVDADLASLCGTAASCDAGAYSGYTQATAGASSSIVSQNIQTSFEMVNGEVITARIQVPEIHCDCWVGQVTGLATSSASAGSSRRYRANSSSMPYSIRIVANVYASNSWEPLSRNQIEFTGRCPPPAQMDCFPWIPFDPENPPTISPSGSSAGVTQAEVTTIVTHTDITSVLRSRGVLGRKYGADPVRLGFFEQPAFDPGANGDFSGYLVLPVGGTYISPTEVTISMSADNFRAHDGDIDGDEHSCWVDRVLMSRLVGKTINDPEYTARADFDLDGDIDTADQTAFNLVHNVGTELVSPCQAPCQGDANIDGVINYPDITSVLANWGTTGPPGDADRNGMVNYADITSVNANWGAPCP